jgi:hypothetical protein
MVTQIVNESDAAKDAVVGHNSGFSDLIPK